MLATSFTKTLELKPQGLQLCDYNALYTIYYLLYTVSNKDQFPFLWLLKGEVCHTNLSGLHQKIYPSLQNGRSNLPMLNQKPNLLGRC